MEVSSRIILLLSDTRLTVSVATALKALLHQSATLDSDGIQLYLFGISITHSSLLKLKVFFQCTE